MEGLSGIGLVLYGFTVTFAGIDWVMSLEPRWYSTIYGLLFMVGQALAAMAFSITMLIWLSDRKPLSQVVRPAHFQDLGSFLLTFVMLWAYMEFSQFLIIWGGNLSDEIPWYIRRMQGVWGHVGLLLVILNFAFPFFLLLFRHVKRQNAFLADRGRAGSVDAPGGYVLDGFAGIWRRKCSPDVDERGASAGHGRNLVLVFSLAIAAHADFAGSRSAHGRNVASGGGNMDKPHNNSGTSPGYETRDANTGGVFNFLVALAVTAGCHRPGVLGNVPVFFDARRGSAGLRFSFRGHAAVAAGAAVAGESSRGLAESFARSRKSLWKPTPGKTDRREPCACPLKAPWICW